MYILNLLSERSASQDIYKTKLTYQLIPINMELSDANWIIYLALGLNSAPKHSKLSFYILAIYTEKDKLNIVVAKFLVYRNW